jgi:hypothetical protein
LKPESEQEWWGGISCGSVVGIISTVQQVFPPESTTITNNDRNTGDNISTVR